jgi:hypothetical protein
MHENFVFHIACTCHHEIIFYSIIQLSPDVYKRYTVIRMISQYNLQFNVIIVIKTS